MLKRLFVAAVVVSPLCLPSDAEADLQITAKQDGSDVVFSFEGSVDRRALTADGPGSYTGTWIAPSTGFVTAFPGVTTVDVFTSGISFPSAFGGSGQSFADSNSVSLGLQLNLSGIAIQSDYVDGTDVTGSLIFNGESIQSLKLFPGEYTWSWPDVVVEVDVEGSLSTAIDGIICKDRPELSGLHDVTFPDTCTIPGDSITLTVVPEPSAFLYGGLISGIVGCCAWAKRRFV